jgi:hypothetical protein
MGESDFVYYERRAGEELVAAVNARSVDAARIHRELADRMRQRAEALKPVSFAVQSADAA